MGSQDVRSIVASAFKGWADGSGYVAEIFDDDLKWEIVGHSAASKQYFSKKQFVDEVLLPFGERFKKDAPFRPVKIRGIYVDGTTAVVFWDGEGTTLNETSYANTYAWFMTFEHGLVVN